LHAGVKYSLGGLAGDDAAEAAAAAEMWVDMLSGAGAPNLSGVRVVAPEEFLWRTAGFMGAAGMLGAKLALRTVPHKVVQADRPVWLAGAHGEVLRLRETVIDPQSLLQNLCALHAGALLHGEVRQIESSGESVRIDHASGECVVRCKHLVLCAGEGNAALLAMAGVAAAQPMQRRALRQAMVRGNLPMVFGHCIDAAKTRVTITSDTCKQGVVWHVGGELAEQGAALHAHEFVQRAAMEISACLPAVDLRGAQWSSYTVDRAEPRTSNNRRPSTAHVQRAGSCIVVWPVKLVMAPRAAQRVVQVVRSASVAKIAAASAGGEDDVRASEQVGAQVWPAECPIPTSAPRPWETADWSVL